MQHTGVDGGLGRESTFGIILSQMRLYEDFEVISNSAAKTFNRQLYGRVFFVEVKFLRDETQEFYGLSDIRREPHFLVNQIVAVILRKTRVEHKNVGRARNEVDWILDGELVCSAIQ
jgi:hypothetical protein